ncbi:hypothetical protein ACJ73_05075 [Blastomyces percursus]|uniref:Tc1-like transposase DDE domain-containing protein n=1 Tax=Blastomyces percursus TaxID=1658174 RepID=A0A1J9R4Y4_9EURO|nr:hypothetical protein ACJ73_05075 [Blastomyces percursus]
MNPGLCHGAARLVPCSRRRTARWDSLEKEYLREIEAFSTVATTEELRKRGHGHGRTLFPRSPISQPSAGNMEQAEQRRDRLKLMQDGAPGHAAADTVQDLQERGITPIDWPSYSPDLHPIETV